MGAVESKFYTANSEIETILYGSELENDMVVLIEDRIFRGDEESTSRYEIARAEETNQFCKIRRLRNKGGLVRFIGEYPDGTLRERVYNEGYAWIVKKDSIPA